MPLLTPPLTSPRFPIYPGSDETTYFSLPLTHVLHFSLEAFPVLLHLCLYLMPVSPSPSFFILLLAFIYDETNSWRWIDES